MNTPLSDINDLYRLEDLAMAYRKAKVDMFYSPRACRSELCEFEARLLSNLKRIQKRLLQGQAPALPDGSWTLVPKKITHDAAESDLISSDPVHQWASIREQNPKAEFRLMAALSVEFHVFATLWIQKVGHKFEERLSDAARGNRLRRDNEGNLNPISLGSTGPYLHPYCKWRDDGIGAIRDALDKKKSVVALTADVSSFYHKLDPRFMLDAGFIDTIGVSLNAEEAALHTCFITALVDWAKDTPLQQGLPVGLTASALIANVALFELDQIIQHEVAPLYYGRYVDDIILVMENCSDFRNTTAVWDWLCVRSDGALSRQEAKDVVRFTRPYLDGSEIRFANNKNKVFVLSGPAGKALLASIEHQIYTRTSEWRSLPDFPSEGTQIESSLLTAIQANGEPADSLRKTDKVSVRRAGVALKIRDIEAYSRALPPEAWAAKRHRFFDAFIRHILVLPTFFDFFIYLTRMIELASSCADFDHLRQIIDALERILADLRDCKVTLNALGESPSLEKIQTVFREQLKDCILESIEASFPPRLSPVQRKSWRAHFGEALNLFDKHDIKTLQQTHRNYFKHDLAHRPLKQLLLPTELMGGAQNPVAKKALFNLKSDSARKLLLYVIVEGVTTLSRMARIPGSAGLSMGLLFPTRPPNIQDLYLLHPQPFSSTGAIEIATCLLGLRGFKPEGKLPEQPSSNKNLPIEISFGEKPRHKLRIAVTSWKTDQRSWVAAITKFPDPDITRFDRLNLLINSVLRCRDHPDYLILPELSVPLNWFLAIAGKLHGKGISLICGVEYQHARGKIVRSQTWAALLNDALGFPTMIIYRQDKQRPAQHEEEELKRIGGRVLKPEVRWDVPHVLDHSGFHFAILLCSELTNISYRASLRGQVDALFVPEWNQDTESFDALVESAALDMHAYIVQCNDRQYGDSRIRVPHKDSWERDIVRVKGGLEDYFVVGEIDIQALRQFQSNHRSPDRPFKPVPDGFNISHRRMTLPKP